MNVLITMILAVTIAKKVLVQDNLMDWQGTTPTVCEYQNEIQIMQGQNTISKSFQFQNSILEGTLELYLNPEPDFKIYIDNIQYVPELIASSALYCTQTKYFAQYRITFKTVEQGFSLQIISDGIIEIGSVNVILTTCPDDCLSCTNPDSCDECANGYRYQQGKCLCFSFYQEKCLESCPSDTRVLLGSYICQNIENQTSSTGIEHFFSQETFIFESQQLIGPFNLHQEISGQFEMKISLVSLAFELYMFNSQDEYELRVYINEVALLIFKSSEFNLGNGIKQISDRQCSNQNDCNVYQLQTIAVDHSTMQKLNISISVYDINQVIHRKGMHIIDRSNLQWAIRNLTIIQVNKTQEMIWGCASLSNNTCFKCLGDAILYNNSCVQTCPDDTVMINGECLLIPNYNQFAEILVAQNHLDYKQGTGFLGVKQEFTSDNTRNVVINRKHYFGGYWAGNEFTEVYHLSKHYRLSISAMIKFVDSQNGYFYIKVNGEQRYQVFAQGNSSLKNQTDINMLYTFNHLDPNIMITTGCHDDNFGQCYLSEYTIVQHRCYPYCLECTGNQKQDCTKFSQKFTEFDYLKQDCIDGYFLRQRECSKCHVHNCLECDEFNCIECIEGYYLRHNQCFEQD